MRTRVVSPAVLGLDLSLKRSAAVLIPAGWELGAWGALAVESWPTDDPPPGMSPERQQVERTERIDYVSQRVLAFVTRHRPTHLFLEDYGFSRHSSSVTALGELRGVVRRDLLRGFGKVPLPVPVSAVRRVFFGGALPRSDAKVYVQQALYGAGAPFGNDDECDAYAVAAYGASELGLPVLTFDPPVPAPVAPRKASPRGKRR